MLRASSQPPVFPYALPEIALATADLWSPHKYNSYNEWVCHVAYALAKHAVKDRFVILESLISARVQV